MYQINIFSNFLRKRSEYRRPSQMGVPDIQFHQKQSDYLPYQLQKQNKVFKVNTSTEKGMFGSNKQYFDSESKQAYEDRSATAFKEARSKQIRPKTNLKPENGDITPQKSINRNDYGLEDPSYYSRPSKKGQSQNDNLKPFFQGQMDNTSQNRSEYGKDGLVQRPEKIRPSTSFKPEGQHRHGPFIRTTFFWKMHLYMMLFLYTASKKSLATGLCMG